MKEAIYFFFFIVFKREVAAIVCTRFQYFF